MVGRAVNRLAGRLTAVALTAAMAVSMLVGCAVGTQKAAKKEYKPSAMEQMNAKNDACDRTITEPVMRCSYIAFLTVTVTALGI